MADDDMARDDATMMDDDASRDDTGTGMMPADEEEELDTPL